MEVSQYLHPLTSPCSLSAAPLHNTLDDILITEPAVSRILAEAAAAHRPSRPTDWREYNRLKRELEQFVGWGAKRHQLRNAACWTLAHDALVSAMERGKR